jgi:hypothetical protein
MALSVEVELLARPCRLVLATPSSHLAIRARFSLEEAVLSTETTLVNELRAAVGK